MGVPAFYRWISEKYPKIVSDMLEKRASVVDGTVIPVDLREPNPNNIEYDNLYVDMNGLIHPCSHPEDREAPKTEEEMYQNVSKYLDRLMAAVRPRRLLYLAIDGVAPRAKMNQQRSRRFRAARDANDRKAMMKEVVEDLGEMGFEAPEGGEDWDSNVITPGTDFMYNLSIYIRYYIIEKMNKDPLWRTIKVVLSDANEPGEGEHKIMKFIRTQRNQPGYDPNQRHILHGLDADLIMLALATHEAHFAILREKVTFGRQDREAPLKSDAQRMLDQQVLGDIAALRPQDEWVYLKPLQVLHVNILREYLHNEFSCLHYNVPFGYDLERVIDDFIFLCFFVGNDFLPHLPCLDIRDGALDFLLECYKELLPSLGDYITSPGGNLNLRQADVILGTVGDMETQIFAKRKAAEEANERKQEQYRARNRANKAAAKEGQGHGNTANLEVVALGKGVAPAPPLPTNYNSTQLAQAKMDHKYISFNDKEPSPASTTSSAASISKESNLEAANKLKSLLGKRDATTIAVLDRYETENSIEKSESTVDLQSVAASSVNDGEDNDGDGGSGSSSIIGLVKGSNSKQIKEEIKKRIKDKEQQMIDKNKETIVDLIKLHEEGGKERYYNEPFKRENIAAGGGLKRLCYSYVQGLCWVLKYYYDGVPSWNWYYPFHYAPLASDLINIDMYEEIKFELAEPFRPVEQLLAVLPSNSVHALPSECHWLMLDSSSPIIDLYTGDVPIDPNGQHLPWLWILLLPFIDERRIMSAFQLCQPKLDIYDRRKNALGGSFVFIHADSPVGMGAQSQMNYCPGVETDSDVLECLAKERQSVDDGSSEAVPETQRENLAVVASNHFTFDCELGNGMCGTLEPPHPSGFVRLNCAVQPNKVTAFSPCNDVSSNNVLCFNYVMPKSSPHLSVLLQGADASESILNATDLMPRRPPKLNKMGFNVLELYNAMRGVTQRQYAPQQNDYNNGGRGRDYVLTGQFQERQFGNCSRNNGGYNNNNNNYNNNVYSNNYGYNSNNNYNNASNVNNNYNNYNNNNNNYNSSNNGSRSDSRGQYNNNNSYDRNNNFNQLQSNNNNYSQSNYSHGNVFNNRGNSQNPVSQQSYSFNNRGSIQQGNVRGGSNNYDNGNYHNNNNSNYGGYGSASGSGYNRNGAGYNNQTMGYGQQQYQQQTYSNNNNNNDTNYYMNQFYNGSGQPVGQNQGGRQGGGGGSSMQSMKDQLMQTLQGQQNPQQQNLNRRPYR